MYIVLIAAVLLEYLAAAEKVSAFHLFAVAKIEFGAESGYNNRRNQIPPLDRSSITQIALSIIQPTDSIARVSQKLRFTLLLNI